MAEYIDREAFIETVKDIPMWGSVAVMFADSIPTADVAPVRHGQWINSGTGYNWCYECSACGWKDGHPFEDRHNYCPNCGAKMDWEE